MRRSRACPSEYDSYPKISHSVLRVGMNRGTVRTRRLLWWGTETEAGSTLATETYSASRRLTSHREMRHVGRRVQPRSASESVTGTTSGSVRPSWWSSGVINGVTTEVSARRPPEGHMVLVQTSGARGSPFRLSQPAGGSDRLPPRSRRDSPYSRPPEARVSSWRRRVPILFQPDTATRR